jgi:uncharacterized protein
VKTRSEKANAAATSDERARHGGFGSAVGGSTSLPAVDGTTAGRVDDATALHAVDGITAGLVDGARSRHQIDGVVEGRVDAAASLVPVDNATPGLVGDATAIALGSLVGNGTRVGAVGGRVVVPTYAAGAIARTCTTAGGSVFHVEQFPHPAPFLPVPIPIGTPAGCDSPRDRGRNRLAFVAPAPADATRTAPTLLTGATVRMDAAAVSGDASPDRNAAEADFALAPVASRGVGRPTARRLRAWLGLCARVAGWPLLALLWTYRRFVSPVLPPACRYHPSCSEYAFQAVAAHGPARGSWLALRRLLRCHPWAAGGPDPVPGTSTSTGERGEQ